MALYGHSATADETVRGPHSRTYRKHGQAANTAPQNKAHHCAGRAGACDKGAAQQAQGSSGKLSLALLQGGQRDRHEAWALPLGSGTSLWYASLSYPAQRSRSMPLPRRVIVCLRCLALVLEEAQVLPYTVDTDVRAPLSPICHPVHAPVLGSRPRLNRLPVAIQELLQRHPVQLSAPLRRQLEVQLGVRAVGLVAQPAWSSADEVWSAGTHLGGRRTGIAPRRLSCAHSSAWRAAVSSSVW